MKITKFEDLQIWQDAIEITKTVYLVTAQEKFNSDFPLRDQLRRAIISISSNIVEGFEKNNNNEFIRFLKIAKGSTGEARSQIYIAHMVGYIEQEMYESLAAKLEILSSQIGAFISYLDTSRSQGKFIKKTR